MIASIKNDQGLGREEEDCGNRRKDGSSMHGSHVAPATCRPLFLSAKPMADIGPARRLRYGRTVFPEKINGWSQAGLYSFHHVRWRAVGRLLADAGVMRSSVICLWAHIRKFVRQAMGRITGESCNSATLHAFGDPGIGSEKPPHRSRRQTIAGTRARFAHFPLHYPRGPSPRPRPSKLRAT